jgi:hypothetical protein
MSHNLSLPKFSIGTGDRFARRAKAQLDACIRALDHGVEIAPRRSVCLIPEVVFLHLGTEVMAEVKKQMVKPALATPEQ